MSNQDIVNKLVSAQKKRSNALHNQATARVLVNNKMNKQIITENIQNRKALAGNLRKLYSGGKIGRKRNEVFKTGSRPHKSFAPPVFDANRPLKHLKGSGIRKAENDYINAWRERMRHVEY